MFSLRWVFDFSAKLFTQGHCVHAKSVKGQSLWSISPNVKVRYLHEIEGGNETLNKLVWEKQSDQMIGLII